MFKDLIYDIGAHLGHDTAYYLHRGYRVIAIEANPTTAELLKKRFKKEIINGHLKIINKALSPIKGMVELYISKSDSGSCSIFSDEVNDIEDSITVVSAPLSLLLKEFGVPYYMKIDIQGADKHCLESLDRNDLPKFISWEMDRDQLECLKIVHNLGYLSFKLIDQKTFLEMHRRFSVLSRIIRKIDRTLKNDQKKELFLGWKFIPCHSSGPFGDDTDGRWRSYVEVKNQWNTYYKKYPNRKEQPSWFDCHAALDIVS
jgi:FkbM family methyltransferase